MSALSPQDVAVVKTGAFGTVLILDGAIQCTDRDEFSYQVSTQQSRASTQPSSGQHLAKPGLFVVSTQHPYPHGSPHPCHRLPAGAASGLSCAVCCCTTCRRAPAGRRWLPVFVGWL